MDYIDSINEIFKVIPESELESSLKRFNNNDAINLLVLIYRNLSLPNNNGLYLKIYNILVKNFGNGVLMNALSQI